MEIPVYRGENKLFTRSPPGKWWSPDSMTAEDYAEFSDRNKKGFKKLNPSKIMKGSVNIDDYKKGIQLSILKHGEDSTRKRYGKGVQDAFKQVDIDVENLKSGKIPFKEFATKYWETLLPDGKLANPKLDIKKTFKPIAKTILQNSPKVLGPLGIGYAFLEFLKGSELNSDQNNNNITYKRGPLSE